VIAQPLLCVEWECLSEVEAESDARWWMILEGFGIRRLSSRSLTQATSDLHLQPTCHSSNVLVDGWKIKGHCYPWG
jgi:hypothetical protein